MHGYGSPQQVGNNFGGRGLTVAFNEYKKEKCLIIIELLF